MGSNRRLSELAALADAALPPEAAVQRALPALQEALDASEVFLVFGEDDGFSSFGSCPDLELSDVALWLVHRDLTSRRRPCAFDLSEHHVVNFHDAAADEACDFVASLVPQAVTGEMLIARGPWPEGFGECRAELLEAAVPAVALILSRRLDSSRAERQWQQLSALANITRVVSDVEDIETVLTGIAGTIAVVTGIDYISIDIIEPDGTVKLRAFNSTRPGTEQFRERWKRGATRPDPVRDAVIATRKPMLFADAQNDERIPEAGRGFFTRTLIRSTGTLPLVTKDEVLGVLSVASHRPRDFSRQEVELLEGLATQVATAVKGIQLYQELAESRRELQHLNEQLQESTGIQHHLARTDALTGIPNRRYLDEALEAECARAGRYGQALSVVMADMDSLKEINDTYSHHAGDEMLRFVATLARESCRQADVVGRYGGDEFVFVLPNTSLDDAIAFAERFRERLANYSLPSRIGERFHLTASLGVAQWHGSSMNGPAALIRQADRVMYEAKAAGRNRTMVAVGDGARAA
jgi:diguanylate cyclase (GGDEF)-like protein